MKTIYRIETDNRSHTVFCASHAAKEIRRELKRGCVPTVRQKRFHSDGRYLYSEWVTLTPEMVEDVYFGKALESALYALFKREELAHEVMRQKFLDKGAYRYIAKDKGPGFIVQRIRREYLDTTTCLDPEAWETIFNSTL